MREMKDSGIEWIGRVPKTWYFTKLKSNYSFEKGKNAAIYTKDYVELNKGEYPVYSGQTEEDGIMGCINSYEYDEEECIFTTTVGAKVMSPKLLSGRFSLSQNCLIMHNKTDHNNNHYVYYMLLTLFDYEKSLIPSYMQPSLRIEDLKRYCYYAPQNYEQKRIADYLDSKCSKIDEIIAKQEKIIEKLKEYKLSVITEAVTKGLNTNVELKNSGIEWLGRIPDHWKIHRIANLYDESVESGDASLPILTVSINSGISDRELSDEESDRVFVRSEDRTKYKRVKPGYLAYNMMRAWQGAFGAARVDGMVSPAYVVAKVKSEIEVDSRYIEALLRTPIATEEMHRYSHGIADFRLRLYWPEFKNIRICIPPINEQVRIADYIDNINEKIDCRIEASNKLINKLSEYKKSLVYEVVTGKKEV